MPRDPYQVLGVERSAEDAELKKAFRKLARELHPDVNRDDPDAEEKFKEAAEAYEILSDPGRRQTYDQYGHEGLRSNGFSSQAASGGGIEDILSAMFGGGSSPFGDIFGFGGRSGPAPGGDVGVSVSIELAEVLEGATREVSFPRGLALRALQWQRRRARDADPHLRDVRRAGRRAAGHAHALRPDDAPVSVPDLQRRGQDP